MQRGCTIVQWTRKEYYCIVAQEEYDYDYENFRIYGPAETEEKAFERMSKYESNPGGYSVVRKNGKPLAVAFAQWIIRAIRKYKKNGFRNS